MVGYAAAVVICEMNQTSSFFIYLYLENVPKLSTSNILH